MSGKTDRHRPEPTGSRGDGQASLDVLRARLAEAEETLRAIRAGEVDALLIDGARGERIRTFEGAERPYSLLVEAMSEGAALILSDGTILFCNGRLAEMAARPLDGMVGLPLQRLLCEASIPTFEALVRRAAESRATGEIQLRAGEAMTPVLLSIRSMAHANVPGFSLVATDLTEQKRSDEMILAEKLARSILDQAADGIVVCDPAGRVLRASEGARRLCGENPLLQVFGDVFPLDGLPRLGEDGRIRGAEATLHRRDGQTLDLLVSATPLQGADGQPIGRTYTLTDLTERRRAERERDRLLVREQEARRDAEAASRAKDEFLAILSHELRTPLTAMLGWTRLLRDGKLDARTTARALEVVERSATTQARLINDILDVSRIIAGKLGLNLETIESLGPIIGSAAEALRPAAVLKGVELTLEVAPELGALRGDPDRLVQVISNLISNSIKFTPRGGRVTVRCGRAGEKIELLVIDDGIGIARDFLPHIFERFRQAETTSSRSYGGLGLGLAIVRHIVELHGGTINAESAGAGRGSSFTVRLPLLQDASRAAQQAPASSERYASLEGVRVLVVEDEPDARSLFKMILEDRGASVQAVGDVGSALDAAERWRPHVVLSDIGLPGEDGYSLIRRLRARGPAQGGDVPAVAVTAYASYEDRERLLKAGFRSHMPKPVDPESLVALVASLVGRVSTG